jgi:uncharacterized membrane protein
VSDAIYDFRPEQYPTVIREMIRHENDATNHRINTELLLVLAAMLEAVILVVLCLVWVWCQGKDEEEQQPREAT